MNITKEKKLNAIKSEILEITEYLKLNNNDKNFDIGNEDEIDGNSNDTLTLTKIVNCEPKIKANGDLTEIKNELHTLKLLLNKNEVMLKEILLKIK